MDSGHMLTTFDNPFNPFVDFRAWFSYDCEKKHNTCGRLARLVELNSEMTEKEIDEEKERAMDFIIKYDLEEKFFKGTKEEIDKWLNAKKNGVKFDETQTATAANA